MLKDPVCGMTVTEQSRHAHLHDGKPMYFYSAGRKAKFATDPDGRLLGLLAVSDPIKASTAEALAMSLSLVSVITNALRLRTAPNVTSASRASDPVARSPSSALQ